MARPVEQLHPVFSAPISAGGGIASGLDFKLPERPHAVQFTPHRQRRTRRRLASTAGRRRPGIRAAVGGTAKRAAQQLPFRFHVQLLGRHAGRRRGAAVPATQRRETLAGLPERGERARAAECAAAGGRTCRSPSARACSRRCACGGVRAATPGASHTRGRRWLAACSSASSAPAHSNARSGWSCRVNRSPRACVWHRPPIRRS